MPYFIFESYSFDAKKRIAEFHYSHSDGRSFCEKIIFTHVQDGYNKDVFDRALFLAFLTIGTSYYKTFPTREIKFADHSLDKWQASFANSIYQEGLSQFAFENDLKRDNLAYFTASSSEETIPAAYKGSGILALQSGGKDSLLSAVLLQKNNNSFLPWYLASANQYPDLLDKLDKPVITAQRQIDHPALKSASQQGALNGHVPVTYIVLSIALLEAILNNINTVIASIGHEGEEPHATIGDLNITHQWSKTWQAEKLFAEYVQRYISKDINVGSPLRGYSELYITELFAQYAWKEFGHTFSSCNQANYKQGQNNQRLTWCGNCAKCANSYLLFAPFIHPTELKDIFNGEDLFLKASLQNDFKGLLGIDEMMKPFECVGEVDELRRAYHMSQERWGNEAQKLSFTVPDSLFDYKKTYPMQDWAKQLLF